ncbi:MAG: hypothetical protein WAV29_04145, partial [Microgenomates group bacterium]
GGGGGGGGGTCTPACTAPQVCKNKQCVNINVCDPVCAGDEICNNDKKCVPNPSCPAFVKASVAPSTVRPFDQVTVKCNYGKRLDCLSVTGAGLKNCRYSRFENTDNIFVCDASPNGGFFDDTKCITKTGTADKCCNAEKKVGDLTILGSAVEYDQDIVLPFGTYTLSSRVFSVISKGKGVKVSLICNSDTCTSTIKKNGEIDSITFPEFTDFTDKTKTFTIKGTGDDRHYLVRVSVDKGSEAYFDYVSLKDSKQRELVENYDFAEVANTTISTKQPMYWGEADNKIGYYYGSVSDEQVIHGVIQPTPPGGGGGGTAPGGGTPGQQVNVSLALKIKLQGIVKKPAKADNINVQVKLAGGGLTAATAYKTVSFSVDGSGIWSGKVDFDKIPTGGGYRVYIKGPKHIAKKICDGAPSESKGGEYHCGDGKITLKAGENTFDFSKIIQLGGDLPEASGKQNGIIDAYDTTFIRQNLGSTDAGKMAIGDINLDNIIDTQDYSIVVQSLSIKYDEE